MPDKMTEGERVIVLAVLAAIVYLALLGTQF